MIEPGQLVMLVCPKGKRFFKVLKPAGTFHTHDGTIDLASIGKLSFGQVVFTHIGRPYRVLSPTLYDVVKNIKRSTQIIYPKEIGYILMKLGIRPGSRVVEAGSGSGSLTLSLAWFVGDSGQVYTYERRPEFTKLCTENLETVGLNHRVSHFDRDIAEGFEQTDADALFLDVRTPWEYLNQASAAVIPGAPLGFLLPTVNQVSDLLAGFEGKPFADIEVLEILLRRYKPVADRLRPEDRMVAHTGFLIFARYSPDFGVDQKSIEVPAS